MTLSITRKPQLVEKVVMVGGLDGCGKTLFSSIISALDRVELQTYSYEIEHYCTLNSLNQLSLNTASALIRMQTDLKLYNVMMSREVNFRPTDLSSVLNYHNPTQYFERLFQPGDKVIPEVVRRTRPILNLTIHSVLFASDPIWNALGDRCVFVEVVRHPLYMFRQQALNMNNLVHDVRDFIIYCSHKDGNYPYWTQGWEDIFEISSGIEKSVHYIDQMTQRTERAKKVLKEKFQANIITIPFEQFVLDPDPWLMQIATALGSEITDATRNEMYLQKVPREKVALGIDLEIYRRCGWEPPKDGSSERDELNIRREDIVREASTKVLAILDKLSDKYEKKFWNPDDLD
jgi:hypothetical protein